MKHVHELYVIFARAGASLYIKKGYYFFKENLLMYLKSIVILLVLFPVISWGCDNETVSKEFNEEYVLESAAVVVENVNGFIDVKTWDKNVVNVQAKIEVRGFDRDIAQKMLEQVKIEVRKNAQKLSFIPDYPDLKEGDSFFGWIIGHRNKPQVIVNFKIMIPKKVDVKLTSVNGSIDLVDLDGEADLETVNGEINANNIYGPTNAKTVNGGINVKVTKSKLNKTMNFKTVNGGITLNLPDDINADLEISTLNGGIKSDFPVTIQGDFGSQKNISATINNGGERIYLNTVNGGVSLYKN